MFAVHGGIGCVSLCIALLLVIPSVSPPVSSLFVVKGVFGASVTLPCDGSAFRGTPEAQLDVLWRTYDGEKVAQYSRGVHSVGVGFQGRVTFSTERIRQGDISINISSVTFRDEDLYECVWNKVPDEIALNDVRLYVLEPPIPNHLSVPVGDPVTLPCYGRINKEAPEESFVQWKRGDELVLKYGLDEVTYGPKYEGRASVSSERILKGNFSLSLSVTGVCDSGVYQCSTDQNQNVTSIVLELTDYRHYKSVSLSLGTPFSLSLPKEPVKVIFSKEGTLPKVPLCSVDKGGFKCEPKYRVWTEWKNLTVTSDDVGTYTVIHSWNCLISHAYGVNIKHDNNNYYLFFLLIPIVVIVVVCIVCIRILCVQRKRKKSNNLGHGRVSESVSTFSQDDAADQQAHLTCGGAEYRSGQ